MLEKTDYVPETPQWKEHPPAGWLNYHLAHPGPTHGGPGDPNPAFFYNGRYHLHYIYWSVAGGGHAFGHVSSTDMVHWEWHPTTLVPKTTGHGMFSGTGFFTPAGQPAMVYHGEHSRRNHIAYALDDHLDKWSKPEEVLPVDAEGKPVLSETYWDPDLWFRDGTYYSLNGRAADKSAVIMKSDNLKDWRYIGELLHPDFDEKKLGVSREEDISCANMFKIGNKWMLLCISHRLGCRYFLGDFVGEQFLPDHHEMMNFQGVDYFAPESLLTPDGRRVMWAWAMGQAGGLTAIQSLPRELYLPEDGKLRMKPLRELESLRYDPVREENITVRAGERVVLEKIAGDSLEIEIKCKIPDVNYFGIDVLWADHVQQGTPIFVNPVDNTLMVGTVIAPFENNPGDELTLRIFIDKNYIEVFANDIQAVFYNGGRWDWGTGVSLFANGGDVNLDSITAWKMKSAYRGKAVYTAEQPRER